MRGVEPAPLATDLRAGTELGAYRLERVIGRGGMGVVYLAEHRHLRRRVALKLLDPELADDAEFRERFLRESRVAASLDHPSVVTVHDAGEADGHLYIAMQYLDGTDLAQMLREQGALEPARALAILGQVADALDTAHAAGVVHRDVKPGNVLIDERRAYLTDFGLTRRISSDSALTRRGDFVGTVDYMSPEQIQGAALDGRADVYSLGCVLYHALAGSVPYPRASEVSVIYAHMQEPPPSVVSASGALPSALDAVVARALAKRRDHRYGTCGELIAAAEAALAQEPPRPAAALRAAELRRVLVADDDATTRALVRYSLAEREFEVLEARDPDTALALARGERPDVLLVGWELGGTSGADLCRALRAEPGLEGGRIVAITARSDAVDAGDVRRAGFDGALRKPFSSFQLAHVLDDVLAEGARR